MTWHDNPARPDAVRALDTHPDIRRKVTDEGVTCYNFTRRAFHEGRWDDLTTRARGLFVRDDRVVGRGFDKFFELGDPLAPSLDDLVYPVRFTRKVNGFLAIVFALDKGLRVWSKAGPTDYGRAAEKALTRLLRTRDPYLDPVRDLTDWLADHDVSMLCEVTLPQDPHLIDESGHDQVMVLAVVENSFDFTPNRPLLGEAINQFGLQPVDRSTPVRTRAELERLIESDREASVDRPVEGVVIADTLDQMVKVKYEEYGLRKRLRRDLGHLYSGRIDELPAPFTELGQRLDGIGGAGALDRFMVSTPSGHPAIDVPRLLRVLYPGHGGGAAAETRMGEG